MIDNQIFNFRHFRTAFNSSNAGAAYMRMVRRQAII